MFTKVGSKIFNVELLANASKYYIETNTLKAINGSLNSAVLNYNTLKYLDTIQTDNTSGSAMGVIALVGVGDTPVTAEDYRLDEMTVGGVDVNTIVQCTSARFPVTTARGISYLYQFTNTGSSAVTIKEICICLRLSQVEKYMLARKVIPPRTIQPNENVTFDFDINWF